MASEILVTVLMSVHNEENNIDEAIQSILSQTYDNFEFIIIDDASTDSTVEKIIKYTDKRIIFIQNEINMGLTKNLNRGIELAKGKYIFRMDGDDISVRIRFEEQVAFMEMHPEIVLSGSWIRRIGVVHDVARYKTTSDELKSGLLFNGGMAHPTFIIRKSIVDKYAVRYNENLRYAQDYDFIYKMSQYGEVSNIPKVLLKYRIHDNQISNRKLNEQRKCADCTRRTVLDDLGIVLTEEEFSCWSMFCVTYPHVVSETEKEVLEHITEAVLKANRHRKIFNQKYLERDLTARIRRYYKNVIEDDKSQLKNSVFDALERDKLKENADKYLEMFILMNRWVEIKQKGKSLVSYFERNGYRTIAIYGMGYVGERLEAELKNSNIQIEYGIDQIPDSVYTELITFYPEDMLKRVDAVVVTSVYFYDEIKKKLIKKIDCPIISLEDILDEID